MVLRRNFTAYVLIAIKIHRIVHTPALVIDVNHTSFTNAVFKAGPLWIPWKGPGDIALRLGPLVATNDAAESINSNQSCGEGSLY